MVLPHLLTLGRSVSYSDAPALVSVCWLLSRSVQRAAPVSTPHPCNGTVPRLPPETAGLPGYRPLSHGATAPCHCPAPDWRCCLPAQCGATSSCQ